MFLPFWYQRMTSDPCTLQDLPGSGDGHSILRICMPGQREGQKNVGPKG